MADDVDLTELDYDFLGFTFQQNEQYKKFNNYIEKHTSPLDASVLQWDLGDTVVDEGLPNSILIAFRSMGSWMVVNHEGADTHAGGFDSLKQKLGGQEQLQAPDCRAPETNTEPPDWPGLA
ncbi:hypothetical protein HAP47_0026275 [Bradyrhizobium sp. 41S5]|uniref:hypothetical protein n=1 Tax=Bradyrhizobium sp. 41S5 TaxID=1404443 RepID=UPI00156AB972|nr:hypothetical protein [Bradyrhizobium sp. 41S5]UFX42729.1 hypothetical protein HAP47_0026275 [Bradyrhizobium sp. 41S5]